ncbi:hypothetical protein F6V25_15195 [Oryzomonas japonica]|uniref:DUF4136 domain-containing protein n=1 Tax=Oryzomonas japonica TaxID=2603858 RepID=A0A7J4ZMV1_9BACT|nr:hypothetical protein [Oryzomonas japonica]KAB0663777.1 hypothetical protein F6V25_15195 [Oryzomonas japonica]
MKTANLFIVVALTPFMLYGCTAFLPTSKEIVRVPWDSYQDVQAAYEKVARNQTTVHQLKKVGFDIYSTPNVKILNYIDIAATIQNIKYEDLSGGLAQCIKVRENCRGYQIEPKVMVNERHGNFWLDIFNFKRKTKGTGWRFKAIFLVINDVIVDKFWDGDPKIIEDRETKNPLGPLQEAGGLILRLVP